MTNRVLQFLDGWPGDNAPALIPDPSPLERSGSSYGFLTVLADGGSRYYLPDGRCWVGGVTARLEKTFDGKGQGQHETCLVINAGDSVCDPDHEQPTVRLELLGPGALRGLIRTLMELEASSIGAKILAEITPDPENVFPHKPEEGQDHTQDDDEGNDDGEEWKRPARV